MDDDWPTSGLGSIPLGTQVGVEERRHDFLQGSRNFALQPAKG